MGIGQIGLYEYENWPKPYVVQFAQVCKAECADAVATVLSDEGTYAAVLHLLPVWLSSQRHSSGTTKGDAYRQQVGAQHTMTSSLAMST